MRLAETTSVSDIQAGLYPLLESPIELLKEKSFFPRDMTRREFLKILLVLLPLVFVLPTALYYVLETIILNEFWSFDLTKKQYEELLSTARVPNYGILPDYESIDDIENRWVEADQIRQETGSEQMVSFFSVLSDVRDPVRREAIRTQIHEIDGREAEIMINLGMGLFDSHSHPLDPIHEVQTKELIDEYLEFLATIPTKNKKYLRFLFEFNIGGDIAYGMENQGIDRTTHERQFKKIFRYCATQREKYGLNDVMMVWCVSANNFDFIRHYPGHDVVDCIGVDIYDVFPKTIDDVKYWGKNTRRQNFRKIIESLDDSIEELTQDSPKKIRKFVTEYGSLTKDAGVIEQMLVTFFSRGWEIAMYFNYNKANHHSATPLFQLGAFKIFNRYEIDWKMTMQILQKLIAIRRDCARTNGAILQIRN